MAAKEVKFLGLESGLYKTVTARAEGSLTLPVGVGFQIANPWRRFHRCSV